MHPLYIPSAESPNILFALAFILGTMILCHLMHLDLGAARSLRSRVTRKCNERRRESLFKVLHVLVSITAQGHLGTAYNISRFANLGSFNN